MYIASMDEKRVVAILREACRKAGSQSAWAAVHGIQPQYVSAVLKRRQHPGPQILRALGLTLSVSYRRDYAETKADPQPHSETHKEIT